MASTVKKGKKEPLTAEEKVKQYEGDGMVFKGKVIGIDDVEAARGDKMCQDSMNKLKLAVKASGAHKQRITISVSLQGLKIIDLASGAINHRHPVHKISFIARDVTDNRAFGWVFSPGEGQHKFFAIKTEKQAEAVVLSIRDLFQTVYNVKKAEMDKKKQAQQDGTTDPTNGESYYQSVQSTKVKSPKKRRKDKGSPTNESSYDSSTGEPIYQGQLSSNHLNSNTLQLTACLPRVPTNKPVGQDGEAQPAAAEQSAEETKAGAQVGNLLDLEEELQSLQTGIKDMDKLADLFAAQPNDPFSSPDSTANTPNTTQQDLFGSPVAPVRLKQSRLSPWASTPVLNTASPSLTPYQKPSFGLFSTTEFIQKDKAAFDKDKFVERWKLSLNNDSLFRKNRRQLGSNSDIARSRPKSRNSMKIEDWQSFEDPTPMVNDNRFDVSVKNTTNAPPVKEPTTVSSSVVPRLSHPITSAISTFENRNFNGSSPTMLSENRNIPQSQSTNHNNAITTFDNAHFNGSSPVVLSENSNIPQSQTPNHIYKPQAASEETLNNKVKFNPFAQEPDNQTLQAHDKPLQGDNFPTSTTPTPEVSRERMMSSSSTIKSPVSPDWVDPFATYQETPKAATPSSEYDQFLFDKARLELIKSIHQEKPEPPPSLSRNPFRSSLGSLEEAPPTTRKMEVIPEKPENPFNPFRSIDSQDSASEPVAPQAPARRRKTSPGLKRSQSLVTLNEILTPVGSSSLPGSSATTPGDDFLNSLLQPIKANQPLQPIPVNQSQPVLIPTPVNNQSQSKLQPSPSSQLSAVSLPPPPNSKSQPVLQSTPVNQSQTSLHSDTSSQSSGPSFPSLDSGSSKTSPERQIGVIRVLDDPFADSPFQQSANQSDSFSSSSSQSQSNPFSDSPFTVDRKEFVNGVSTTPVVNPFGGGDFSKPTTSFTQSYSTGGMVTRETKTVFSTPVNKDLVKSDPFGDSFRVTSADSSTLATSAISTSFPEDSERRGNQPPANQAFASPGIQQQIDPFGGSFTAPPAQQPAFSQAPMGFNQPQAGFGQGFGTAPMATTMQSPPMMAQPGFGSPAGFGASPFNATTSSVGLNTAAIASPALNTAGQPLVRRPPPEEPKKSQPDPFADLLDYAADQDKKQMAPPDEVGVEGTSDAFSAYFGSAVGIEADEEAESKPPPSGPPPPLLGGDLTGPAPPPRPSANGMAAPTPAPRSAANGPASSDPFGFGNSFGDAPPKPTRAAAPPTAEIDPFGLGSLAPTPAAPAANPAAPSNDPFGNEPFAPFDFGGGDSKSAAKQAPPKPDPFGLDPFTQQVG
ncbi:nascent polypeptide-associated complex subunit alpha, muscle-specific form-like isoform X3 [Branchiostoma floridae]|uniref:Nascent polypeptide-associated complex subunit alpha, muscle-specific form-like isoform X3 n=1 Tax=Branchiostoma floridae TaxID=7739 RepID=A0A9J7NDQ7_BRAFL|nr:nascent polypeptide-associated complex subunit alpha, muscle-specific form-like isoform X3 [Branchiostoma floridae]